MSNIKELVHDIQTRLEEWDATHGVVFIRTNDVKMRQRLQRTFNRQGVPTVNIFTHGERIKGLIEENKLVVVISAVRDADRFIEKSEELIHDAVSQRVFRLVKTDNPQTMLEPVVGEVVIQY